MPAEEAYETIAHVIGGLVGMMGSGRLPAVDFADLRVMFERDPDGQPKIWYVGVGSAAGEARAGDAATVAAADLKRQADGGTAG